MDRENLKIVETRMNTAFHGGGGSFCKLNQGFWAHRKQLSVLNGFTMAEILISLTIIGIIAAITLPSLRANINETAWNTQRKALYSRMSQAISMLPSLNGYGIGTTEAETTSNAAITFVTDGLSKVLEINNICDNTHLKDCGIVSKYKNTAGSKKDFPTTLRTLKDALAGRHSYGGSVDSVGYSLLNTNAAAFETKNGESIAVFYQPNCKYFADSNNMTTSDGIIHYAAPYMCANFIYDLNGKKGPNTAGKDIGFITAFYPSDSHVVMPIPLNKDSATGQTYANALKVCRNVSPDLRLPNKEELAAINFNNALLNISDNQTNSQASTFYAATKNWKMSSYSSSWSTRPYFNAIRVRCIKR